MTTILTKKKDTTGAPAPGDLTNAAGGAELAVNTFDKRLYTKDSGGNVVEIGTNPTNITAGSISDSGNLTFTGTGNRIIGDFSNATQSNRVAFQTSTANSPTAITAIPSGTGTQSSINLFDNSDPTNAGTLNLVSNATEKSVRAGITGTGTYLPLTMYTGGSERLRIDTSGNVGIGTSTPGQKLHVAGAGSTYISVTSSNAATGSGLYTANATNAYYIGAGAASGGSSLEFRDSTNSATRMVIDSSGNVGIGTSSPTAELDVRGGLNVSDGTTTVRTVSASSVGFFGTSTNHPLAFRTNNTERMRIDSSGKIGINGTPQTGVSAQVEVLQVLGTDGATSTAAVKRYSADTGSPNLRTYKSRASSIGTDTIVQSGDSVGAWTGYGYDGSAYTNAAQILMNVDGTPGTNDMPGRITFSTTADGTSTLTERMRIDSSGKVLIGTTTAGTGATGITVYDSTQSEVRLQTASSGTGTLNGVQIALANLDYYQWNFEAGAQIFGTSNTERMRIDSSGNVGIGTSSPTARLTVSDASGRKLDISPNGSGIDVISTSQPLRLITSDASNMIFQTNNAERMRITAGGSLLVGTTTNRGAGTFFASSGNAMGVEHSGSGTVTAIEFRQGTPSAVVGSITMTGGSSTAYNTSSDYRLKENIAPMTGALDKVAQLKPVTYTWKADGSHGQGFIAHELQEFAPYAVSGEKDGKEMQGVDYGKITPLLTAALQEALAKIESLEARLAALESK